MKFGPKRNWEILQIPSSGDTESKASRMDLLSVSPYKEVRIVLQYAAIRFIFIWDSQVCWFGSQFAVVLVSFCVLFRWNLLEFQVFSKKWQLKRAKIGANDLEGLLEAWVPCPNNGQRCRQWGQLSRSYMYINMCIYIYICICVYMCVMHVILIVPSCGSCMHILLQYDASMQRSSNYELHREVSLIWNSIGDCAAET